MDTNESDKPKTVEKVRNIGTAEASDDRLFMNHQISSLQEIKEVTLHLRSF